MMKTDNNLIKGHEIADLFDVSRPAVSMAIKKDHLLKGHRIRNFAVFKENGHLKGIRREFIDHVREKRENPEKTLKETIDKISKPKNSSSSGSGKQAKAMVMEDNSIRFLDDAGASSMGQAITATSAIMVVPKTIDSINNLQDYNRDALFATFITATFGILGYMAGGEKRSITAVGSGAVGLGLYSWYKSSRTLGEDKAMLGSNPSASQRTGIEEPEAQGYTPPKAVSGSNIYKMR